MSPYRSVWHQMVRGSANQRDFPLKIKSNNWIFLHQIPCLDNIHELGMDLRTEKLSVSQGNFPMRGGSSGTSTLDL